MDFSFANVLGAPYRGGSIVFPVGSREVLFPVGNRVAQVRQQ